jgi:hypothetical protein
MKITREKARQIAKDECLKREWPWLEPVHVRWGWFSWHVWGGGRRGCNLFMRIRKRDGRILQAGMTPK